MKIINRSRSAPAGQNAMKAIRHNCLLLSLYGADYTPRRKSCPEQIGRNSDHGLSAGTFTVSGGIYMVRPEK